MTRHILAGVTGFVFLALAAGAREPPPAKQLSFPLTDKQKLEFVWIEPGRFQMGSPATDKLADEAEKPQREVRIEKGFYLGRTTVTFGQFQEFVLDVAYRTDAETDRRFPGGHGYNTDRNTFEGWSPQYTWRNPGWPQTSNTAIVKLLLKRKASLDMKDRRFENTPLGWALHGWLYPPPEAKRRNHMKVVALLVNADATVDRHWLENDGEGQRMRADPRMFAALGGKILPSERRLE
jgi:hypothetical protein